MIILPYNQCYIWRACLQEIVFGKEYIHVCCLNGQAEQRATQFITRKPILDVQ